MEKGHNLESVLECHLQTWGWILYKIQHWTLIFTDNIASTDAVSGSREKEGEKMEKKK